MQIPSHIQLSDIQAIGKGSMVEFLEIEFTEIGENYLVGKMPVNNKTKQPFGLLHGGASVVLAETLGSIASNLVLEEGKMAVGLEINANHIKSVRDGYVYGKAQPVHLGKHTHVWSIEIRDESDNMVCISRLTVAVIDKK
jgi:1,4-dihydroxy-2-naphthoyl-CoA hydrolase